MKLFTCPITLNIMDNPATTTPCGHMFDMDAIVTYLNTVNQMCPICRTSIADVSLNYAFKNFIEA
jgi:SUMO ligase MMS21 Smc5/6 complex component